MRKISLLLTALAVILVVNFGTVHASPMPDPDIQHVGLVVAYTPNQSITIVDKDGNQFTFTLAQDLKIVPADRANLLTPGAYVTVISPNNVPDGKQIAVGIVIHPQAPNSFPVSTVTFTPAVTPAASETLTNTEGPIEAITATGTSASSEIPAETATPSETPTPKQTDDGTLSSQTNAKSKVTTLVDWLAMFFRQLLSG